MTAESPLGQIERGGGTATLRYTRESTQPPETVWRALTESEHLRWWMPADLIGERAAGATVRMVFWPDLVEKTGLDPDAGTALIEECDPPGVFAYTWHGSRIRFEVTATAGGSELRLVVGLDSDDPETVVDNAAGYHLWMDHLSALLDAGSSPPIADADSQPLQAAYRPVVQEG